MVVGRATGGADAGLGVPGGGRDTGVATAGLGLARVAAAPLAATVAICWCRLTEGTPAAGRAGAAAWMTAAGCCCSWASPDTKTAQPAREQELSGDVLRV